MRLYIARRLLQIVPVLLLTSMLVFGLIRLIPGDPALVMAGPNATPQAIEGLRRAMGLDQPIPLQYLVWLRRVLSGDLGNSFLDGASVGELLMRRLPATVELTIGALLIAMLISIPFGIMSALRERSRVDVGITTYNALALAVPTFWLGILLILVFGLALRWLPTSGRTPFLSDPGQAWRSLLLPAVTLGAHISAVQARFLKAAMLDVLNEDYVRTARAKGLAERVVVVRHALKNALIPVVTIVGLQFGHLLGGAVITEAIFDWPGIGKMVLHAISTRDYAVVQGTILFIVSVFVFVNLLVDILYAYLDPRIRYG